MMDPVRAKSSPKHYVAIGAIIFIVLSLFFIRPAILGYSTYQQMEKSNYTLEEFGQNVNALRGDLLQSQTNLSLYADFLDRSERNQRETDLRLNECLVDQKKQALELTQSASLHEQKIEQFQKDSERQQENYEQQIQETEEELSTAQQECLQQLEEQQQNFALSQEDTLEQL